MQQQEIHDFLHTYFKANDCEILADGGSHLTVQLTIDMDKELMNRPFYWHYLEKTGGIPNPAVITFITDPALAPADLKGEMIHFGSPAFIRLSNRRRSWPDIRDSLRIPLRFKAEIIRYFLG